MMTVTQNGMSLKTLYQVIRFMLSDYIFAYALGKGGKWSFEDYVFDIPKVD